MSDHSGSAHLRVLYEASLQEYEKQTDITLANHPLAGQLQHCDSVESVTAILREELRAHSEFRDGDRIIKLLNSIVSVLCTLSATVNLDLSFSLEKEIYAGLAILLDTIEDVSARDPLVDLLESIESILKHLDIYTKISPTRAMTDIVVKTFVELLSILALATKFTKQGQPEKFMRHSGGYEEMVLERLDRLTLDEARMTAAQSFEVVYGLVQNMRVALDDGKASIDRVWDDLEVMHDIVSDVNRSKRDEMEKDVRLWLSAPDPWQNYNLAHESRHGETGAWFVQGDTFSEWKRSGSSSLLWIHGKPGAGKSVLCSAIIQDIDAMRRAGLVSLAFYYCDLRQEEKRDLRGLVSALLVQLCRQSDSCCDILSKFYSEHDRGSRHPSEDALVGCLKDLLKLSGHTLYLVVDALDECPNTSAISSGLSARVKVLNLIEELIKSRFPNLRICVTSRLETDITVVLEPSSFCSVSLHDDGGQKRDIDDYIKSVIDMNRKSRRWKEEDKELVIDVLTKKVDGNFRWVYCQVVYICGLIPARIRHALAELPETLDETYQRALREINEPEWEIAHRLFQFVAVARRPLYVEELADLLAFGFEEGPIPRFREGWRSQDPVDAVLSTCSDLLAIVDDGSPSGKIIQFPHASVKEFLTSTRLAQASDIISCRYHVSMTPAHTLAAQACLGILLHLDKDVITSDGLEKYPLAEYAAEHWVDHARFEDVSRNVEDGMKRLFDPSKPHLAICVWIHDPEFPTRRRSERAERPLQFHGTPLHYVALLGLPSMVEFLVIQWSQDVDSRHLTNNMTPLHLASKEGQVEVVGMLIECGADVTAQDEFGGTPLHLASFRGQLEAAGMLIERGADVMAKDKYEDTPLHLALWSRQLEVAGMLIERGADVTAQGEYGGTPLHVTSVRGQLEAAGMLIGRGADVASKDYHEDTPLHLALWKGQLEVAGMLIECGADVTAQDKDKDSPLHLASYVGDAEIVRILLEHGADVDARDNDDCTPLHRASQQGHSEVVRVLIEHGANADARNDDNCTPLHQASQQGHSEVVRVLFEQDIDVNARDHSNRTPLHGASRGWHFEVVQLLLEHGADTDARDNDNCTTLHQASQQGHLGVVCVLIKRGTDADARNNDNCTPLHQASQQGHSEVVRVLVEQDIDVNARDHSNWTPLHAASQYGHLEVVQTLLDHGSDADASDQGGWTSLQWPSYNGDLEIVRVLLEYGVDPNTRDHSNWTPLHGASQRGHQEVVQVLLEHGADANCRDNTNQTPLRLASRTRHVGLVQLLIESGANIDVRNNQGRTPLEEASVKGHHDVVQLLLGYGTKEGRV